MNSIQYTVIRIVKQPKQIEYSTLWEVTVEASYNCGEEIRTFRGNWDHIQSMQVGYSWWE